MSKVYLDFLWLNILNDIAQFDLFPSDFFFILKQINFSFDFIFQIVIQLKQFRIFCLESNFKAKVLNFNYFGNPPG